jgi:hypothetical protein
MLGLMWWMTTKWRLDRRGWTIALLLTCLTFALIALGELIPALAPFAAAIVVTGMVVAVVMAMSVRYRELTQHDLRRPPEDDE